MATAKSCLKSHPKPPEDLNYADAEFEAFLTLATKTEPVSFEEDEDDDDEKKALRYQSLREAGSPSPANRVRLQTKADEDPVYEASQDFHQLFDETNNSEGCVIAKEDLKDSKSGSDSRPNSDSDNSQDPDRKLQKGRFKKFIPEERK